MINRKISKLFKWEYWPIYMFYIPNIPFAIYHAFLAKNIVFYTAVNPSIPNSGIGAESKYDILQLFNSTLIPKTILHKQDIENTLLLLKENKFCYPLIAKPNIGFRGLLVEKIDSQKELIDYLNKYPIEIMLQEFINFPNECGIFYYRHPNSKKGKITSITLKKFLTIRGNGLDTINELINKDKRASLYYSLIKSTYKKDLNRIPEEGEIIQLSVIGNHSKGTQFINGNHLINVKLNNTLDKISNNIGNWYYGRLDVKFETIEDLYSGNFKILELNGILAEPTHIYDSKDSNYLKALKTIRIHWKYIYQIAVYNHKFKQQPYNKTFPFIKEMVALKKYSNRLKKLSKAS